MTQMKLFYRRLILGNIMEKSSEFLLGLTILFFGIANLLMILGFYGYEYISMFMLHFSFIGCCFLALFVYDSRHY